MAQFRIEAEDLHKRLKSFDKRVDLVCKAYANSAAEVLTSEMKRPRGVRMRRKDEHYTRAQYASMGASGIRLKWRDRTTVARQRVNTTVETVPEGYRLRLAHGVWYGVYLEQTLGKVYAVIEPALKTKSPEILKGWGIVLAKLFK